MQTYNIFIEYYLLLQQFIKREIFADEFQLIFLEKFKQENRELDPGLYSVLEKVSSDVEFFTKDSNLLKENPATYIDEKKLFERIKKNIEQLELLGEIGRRQ